MPSIEPKELTDRYLELLEAVKLAYRKHCMDDKRIGWEELGYALHDAICNCLGSEAYEAWVEGMLKDNG